VFELVRVTKHFGETAALGPLDLVVESARTTVLIGPSGCGKSTLLRVMMGLIAADAGEVRFQGRTLGAGEMQAFRQRMGYVLQGGGLFPHLTAAQNACLMARHLKRPEPELQAKLAELVTLTRFPEDALARYPAQLSGGQRQRVSLMRALMLDPEVLFLDEPLGALDPMIRHELQTDLRTVFEALGKTVVLVTHDLGEASYLGDRLVLMRAGQVVQQGVLADLERAPADPFVTRFLQAQRQPSTEREAAAS